MVTPGMAECYGSTSVPRLVHVRASQIRLLNAALLLTALLSGCSHRHHASPRPDATSPNPRSTAAAVTPAIPPLTPSQAATLAKNLTAGTPSGLQHALDLPAGQPLDPGAAAQFAAVGPITMNVTTFHTIDATHASVDGSVAHPRTGGSGTWHFLLTVVGGRWKISDAEPAS